MNVSGPVGPWGLVNVWPQVLIYTLYGDGGSKYKVGTTCAEDTEDTLPVFSDC